MNSQNVTLTENNMASDCVLTCPFIGTAIDPHTSVSYPSPANVCHRAKKPQFVSLLHQGQFCRAEAYDTCPTFRQADIPVADVDIAPAIQSTFTINRPLAIIAFALLLIVFGAAYALWPRFSPQKAVASTPMVAAKIIPAQTEGDGFVDVEASPTLIATDQAVSNNGSTATAVAIGLSISKQTTSTPTPTATKKATAVAQPTKTVQPTATKNAATATPIPQTPTTEPAEDTTATQSENVATFDDNITYTYGSGIIDIGKLNVRRGTGPQHSIITTVSKGEIVTLTGRNSDSSWARIRLSNGVVGWVYAEHIIATPPLERLPFIPRSER